MNRLHLLYHELRPVESRYSYVVGCERFQQEIEMFSAMRGEVLPEITFDDGHRSNYEFALPLLAAQGVRARFFLTVGWMENKADFMSWEEVRGLHRAGQEIGAHGWSHALLTHCDKTQMHTELVDAKKTLEDKLGCSITTMSLPGGRSNRRVLEACREAGYTHVYTSTPRVEEEPLRATVGRLNVRGEMQAEWLAGLFVPDSATLASLVRRDRWKSVAKATLGDRVYGRVWALLNRQEPEGEPG